MAEFEVYGFKKRKTKKGYERIQCISCGENYGVFWIYKYFTKNGAVRIVGRCMGCGRYISITEK